MIPSLGRGVTGAHRAHRRGAVLVTLVVAAAGPACYGYRPTELARIQPGEQVRVTLEDSGYRRIAPAAAPATAPRLEGDFQRVTDDSVALSIWIGQAYRGTPFQTAHQTVMLPRDEVLRVERREISTVRTALAAAGVVGAVAYLISQVAFSSAPPGEGGDGPPPPPEPGGGSGISGGFDLAGGLGALLGR